MMLNVMLNRTRLRAAVRAIGAGLMLLLGAMIVMPAMAQPSVAADTYTLNPNLTLIVAAPGVLANDTGFSATTHRIEAYDRVSQFNGAVVVNADGAFSYTPPAGFVGVDSFTYTVRSDSGAATAVVVIDVTGDVVWFVDDSAAAGGDGTYARPFNSFASLNTAASDVDAAGDTLFVFAGNYSVGLTLETNQTLVGEGAGLVLSGLTVPPGTRPNLTNGGGTVITAGAGNTVAGLDIQSTTGPAIGGTGISNLTVSDVAITTTGGGGIALPGASGSIAITNVPISGDLGAGLAALSMATGTATISVVNSPITVGGDGYPVYLSGNSGTVSFDATSDITATAGLGINVGFMSAGSSVTFAGVNVTADLEDAVVLTGNNASSAVNFEEGVIASTTFADGVALLANAGRLKIAGTNSALTASDGPALLLSNVELTQNATFATLTSTGSNAQGVSVTSPVGSNDIVVTGATTVTNAANQAIQVTSPAASGFALLLDTLTATSSGVGIRAQNTALTVANVASTLTATGAAALSADNATLNLAFTTLSSSGGANGITLNNTGGTITATGGTLNSTAGASNHVVNITTSTVNLTYAGAINKGTTGRAVNIDGLTNPGAVSLLGVTTATNASSGVSISNSARAVAFGTLSLGTGGARFTTTPITLASNTGAVNLGLVSIYTDGDEALVINSTISSPGLVSSAADSLLNTIGNAPALVVGAVSTQPLDLNIGTLTNNSAGTHGIDVDRASGTLLVNGTATFGAKTMAAVEITNSSLTTSIKELDITGAAIGVNLSNNTGSFTLTGDGAPTNTDGAGGTFSNLTTHAFNLNNVTNITLNDLQINNTGNHGFNGQAVNGLALDNVDFVGGGNADNEHAMNFKDGLGANLVGTATITDSTFTVFAENGMYLENFSGTLNLTIQNTTFADTDHTYCSGIGCDSHGLLLRSDGNSTMTVLIDNVTFDDITQVGIDAAREGTSTLNITVQNSFFDPTPYTGSSLNDTDNAVRLFAIGSGSGTLNFAITGNVMGDTADGNDADGDDFRGTAGIILVRGGGAGQTLTGVITNNVVADSRNSNGIAVESSGSTSGSSVTRVRVENNVIRNHFNHGINVLANSSVVSGDNHFMDVALMNNSLVTGPSGFGVFPINVSGGDFNRVCARVTGNYGATVGTPIPLGTGSSAMRIRHTGTPSQGQIQLETLTPFTNGNDTSAAAAVRTDNNNSNPISFFTTSSVTSANCQADTN